MEKYIVDTNIIIRYEKDILNSKNNIELIIPESVEDELYNKPNIENSYILNVLNNDKYKHIYRVPPLYNEGDKTSFDTKGLSFVDIDIIYIAKYFHDIKKDNLTVLTEDRMIISVLSLLGINYSSVFPLNNSEIESNKKIKHKKKYETPPAIGVDKLAATLAKVIPEFTNDSGMMVGIFGKWGRGKTYLFRRILNNLTKDEAKLYIPIEFSAWKYTSTNSSWAYLYKSLYEKYLSDNYKKNKYSIFRLKVMKILILNFKKYGVTPIIFMVLPVIAFSIFSFSDKINLLLTIQSIFGIVIFIKLLLIYLKYKISIISVLDKYFKGSNVNNILGFQDKIQEEIKILLEVWIENKNARKVLLFIDDLDRCNIEQVIEILDGLRLILDDEKIHEKIIIIVAVDNRIVKESFKMKYGSFFEGESELYNSIYSEYLEKIFILGIKLPELDLEERKEVFEVLKNHYLSNENKGEKVLTNTKNENVSLLKDEKEPVISNSNEINTSGNKSVNSSKELINNFESNMLKLQIAEMSDVTPRKIKILIYKYTLAIRLYSSITGNKIDKNISKNLIKGISDNNQKSSDLAINRISEMLSVF